MRVAFDTGTICMYITKYLVSAQNPADFCKCSCPQLHVYDAENEVLMIAFWCPPRLARLALASGMDAVEMAAVATTRALSASTAMLWR